MWIRNSMLLGICTVLLAPASRACRAADDVYCGLYALHAALHTFGVQADVDEMIVSDYLSGTHGSTALDLMRLAEKYGVHATYHTRMTLADLRSSSSPILLHTSIPLSRSGFHHWVLFLGMEGDSLRIYDPPRSMYTLSGAELLSQWDGTGVVVAQLARQLSISLPWPDLEIMLAALLIIITGLIVVGFKAMARHPIIGIMVVAAVSALGWHTIVDHGFLRNRYSLATVACRHEKEPLPILTLAQVRERVGRLNVTIVDARQPQAYARSHLPGAINIPITVTHGALRDALAAIPTDNQIIVYCQSRQCGWADAIAHQFPAHGYRHVFVFREGMEAWNTANTVALKNQANKR